MVFALAVDASGADISVDNSTADNSSAALSDDPLNNSASGNSTSDGSSPSDESPASNASSNNVSTKTPFTVSFSMVPATGEAPLEVHFYASEADEYQWDFTSDGVVDATTQNTSIVFSQPGEYKVRLTASKGSQEAQKEEKVTVVSEAPNISVTNFFPTSFAKGEQDITLIFVNNGKIGLQQIKGKIIGPGIQHLSSTSIDMLPSGEEDSLTITVRFLQTGSLKATLKVAGKNIPLDFIVLPESQHTPEELQERMEALKNQIQQQESLYYDKKADGFLVTEMYENIKLAKASLQEAQEDILTNKLDRAGVKLDLLNSSLTDIASDLETAQKQKQTALQWLKENAIAVTAIIAALGTLSGIMIKATQHAKKIGGKLGGKISENVKKMKRKEEKAADSGSDSGEESESDASDGSGDDTKKESKDSEEESSEEK